MRTPIIAGNWKMYKTLDESAQFIQQLEGKEVPDGVDAVICAPYVALPILTGKVIGTSIGIGAQNGHSEDEGAYTGEVSMNMLASIGVQYVIIGHSERRTYYNETDEAVNAKTKAALNKKLYPIVCVGETLQEREANQTKDVVKHQVVAAFAGLSSDRAKKVIIAYEPVWAIGSGKAATADDAEEVCGYIRSVLQKTMGADVAEAIRIQYGGSVKPESIASFMEKANIDGALVGGASLQPDSYYQLLTETARAGDRL